MAVKLADAARWLVPSVVAAATGALAAGITEALHAGGAEAALCAGGLIILLALPLLLLVDITVRGLWRAWEPQQLSLIESDGTAPRLAAWAIAILLGLGVLAAAMFATTQELGRVTSFSPLVVSYIEPVAAVVTMLVLVAISRPVVRVLTPVMPRLTATRIVITLGALIVITVLVLWLVVVRPALGPLDVSVLAAPLVGVVACVLVHVGWRLVPRRASLVTTTTIAVAAAVSAVVLRFANPPVVLAVWGDLPVAGVIVEVVFNLEAIRQDIPMSEFRPEAVPGAPHRDIIVITIDTVRADHTPPYGGHAEMPALASLAEKGAVFDWAFAPSNVTRRSIPSMMIGLSPNRVHGRVVGWALRVDPRHVMLAERMRAGGYETAGFMCCEGFWGKRFHTGLEHGLEHLEIDHSGLALSRKARDWLARRELTHPTRPLFMWMHVLEPHNWTHYGPTAHTDAQRTATYDRALAASDAMLKEVLSAFEHRPPEEWPIIVVTADHGEGLGEHGHPYHSTDLYNSQLRVPLVIAGPSIPHATIEETVSLTDLAPTILELAGFRANSAAFDGASFGALATGARQPDPGGGFAFAAMVKDRSNPGGVTAVVDGVWKLIDEHGVLHVFDTRNDRSEVNDLAKTRPDLVERLRKLLAARVAAGGQSPFEH
jgi:arylsulfatase A-like enzyme